MKHTVLSRGNLRQSCLALILTAALLLLGACTSAPPTTTPTPPSTPTPPTTTTPAPTTTTPAPTPAPPAVPQATLTVSKPVEGTLFPVGNVTVTVQVTNFNLVGKQGQANAVGEGHINYYFDTGAPTHPGRPAIPESGVWASVTSTNYTFNNVQPGTHNISVELVNNDDTPLVPPVVDYTTITVLAPPTLTISSPGTASPLPEGEVTVTVEVTNFNVVDKKGKTNVLGEGHIHYFLDVSPTATSQPSTPASGVWGNVASTTYAFNLSQGRHTITVELVNNDDTPLVPRVVTSITVDVVANVGY